MSLLDPARLPALLGEFAPYFNVDSVEETDSTNDALSRQIGGPRGLPSGSVLVADRQTAGKGRQGRIWASSPESSLTFSVYHQFDCTPMQMSGLSLLVGLAIYRGLCALGAQGLALKWPNDVLRLGEAGQWSKLAGVLIELSPGRHGVAAIIGIGLNLQRVTVPGMDASGIACLADCLPDSGEAFGAGPGPDRHAVLAAILQALHPLLVAFSQSGLFALRQDWQAAHAWQDRQVRIEQAGQPAVQGLCLGIDLDGALLVETSQGVQTVRVGDVSLRPAEVAR